MMATPSLWHTLPRPRRAFFALLVIGLVFFLTWAWSFRQPLITLRPSPFSSYEGSGSIFASGPGSSTIDTSLTTFTHPNAVDVSLADSPFVTWPLRRVCEETEWVPGLNFICDENSGGPGNIRNYMLTCLRYAIASGATGLVMPRIRTRSEKELSHLFGHYQSFSYLFDEAHFRAGLAEACPRMRIWEQAEDIPGIAKPVQSPWPVELVTPKDLMNRTHTHWMDQNRLADRFGAVMREWLDETARKRGHELVSESNHRLVKLRWGVLFEWPVVRDGPEFAATFGSLLRIRDDITELGKEVAKEMRRWAGAQGAPGGGGFLGIHLRTESDSLKFWPDYDMQREGYLGRVKEMQPGPKTAYLATGNTTEAERLGADMRAGAGVKIISKDKLLVGRPELKERLDGMTWDQQALVDFVVLLECDFFMGVNPSSFSVNVALKRHLKGEGLRTRPWKIGGKGDGRSWIVGTFDNYLLQWLFMYDGIWP